MKQARNIIHCVAVAILIGAACADIKPYPLGVTLAAILSYFNTRLILFK